MSLRSMLYLARVLSSPLQTGTDHGVSDVTVVGVIAVVIRHNGDADLGSHGYNHAERELNFRRRKKSVSKKQETYKNTNKIQ